MKFRELTIEEFTLFSRTHKYANFLQCKDIALLSKERNEEYFFFGVEEQGIIIAATYGVRVKILRLYYKYFFPGGFLIDYTNKSLLSFFIKEIKAYTKKQNALYLRFTPNVLYEVYEGESIIHKQEEGVTTYQNLIDLGALHNGFLKGFDVEETSRFQVHLDLSQELKVIRKNYRQNTRNKISAAKRYQTKIRFGSIEDLPAFYEIYKETSQRQGFKVIKSLAFFEKYFTAFSKDDHIKLVFAEINVDEYKTWLRQEREKIDCKLSKYKEEDYERNDVKEIVITKNSIVKKQKEVEELAVKYGSTIISATSIFITYGNEVVYFDSGSYEDLLPLAGQYLIQDTMIEYAKEQGYQRYNFLGFSGNFTNDGVYLFKKGFNGHVVTTVGQFDLPVRSGIYNAYKTLQKVKNRGE